MRLVLLVVFALSCTGKVSGARSGEDPVVPDPVVPAVVLKTAGPFSWLRLTREQYDNSVEAVLKDTRRLARQGFSAEGFGTSGFSTPGLVSALEAERMDTVASQLAEAVSSQCSTDACAKQYYGALAELAFRRPLKVAEQEDFDGIFQAARQANGQPVAESVRWVASAILQSPAFLYLGEPSEVPLPVEERREPVEAYALAARLSYFIWGTTPDAALLSAAKTGELQTAAQVAAQARRLLADPKATLSWHRFFDEWMRVQNVADLSRADPAFAAAKNDLLPQWHAFIDGVLAGDGTLTSLLTSSDVYVTPATAPLLQTPAPPSPLFRTSLPNRFGLLTQLAVLTAGANATEEDPIRRGKLVREQLLCQQLRAPPANIPPLPPVSLTATLRDRHEQHFALPQCRTCHALMDPIGYGFGNYDAVGRFQNQDAKGRPIDASGQLLELTTGSLSFTGASGLAQALSTSDDVKQCVATQLMRFALGRGLEALDAPGETQARERFASAKFDLRELAIAIASSDAFRYRRPIAELTP
jgi:Protein of unknown function (DUF1588)/Protein of unknown function (DUF1592)/Protein of unknown function (DUF1585)/Protein of unknown function (DUF1595)